ncbi:MULTISPECIES: DUF6207 family protein [unclassified Streptomyces]|uniref:DUF6207 family protein n=1 Tax=unclassified Streptomyces TaxID=2593676 RepID=UPI00352D8EBF
MVQIFQPYRRLRRVRCNPLRATSDRTTRDPGQPGVRLRCLDVRQAYSIAQSGAGAGGCWLYRA